ncbi:MAG: HTH-type transcriptional regulator CymR [Firmicutes bacterium]|nr:HTH-type transcriptional regulator CymR [candidate division NPL-UPA2 bacterium]MBT9155693.1 HTH-type transcriptional regulator CymR [candidate division NPL-UPA2 bacterium]
MKFSAKGIYGIRLLVDLATQTERRPVSLKSIAQRQQIPLAYLAQLVSPLITAGIISSARGQRGGIALVRRPEELTLQEVIALYEGPIAPTDCAAARESCERMALCALHDVWLELAAAMNRCLSGITLRDLSERHQIKSATCAYHYHI